MTTEFQPRERLPFYLPENWLPLDTGGVSGSYITYPTAQTANITFPGAILCSNLESFAPSATMNLFNNSTSGDIQFANNFGYSGGIVINADGTPPIDGKIIIGDSARPLLAPLIETDILQGSITSQVEVNSDLFVQTGYTLYANDIEKATGKILSIGAGSLDTTINIGTAAGYDDNINIGTGMVSAGNINLGGALGTTNVPNLESGLISCKTNNALSIGTFAGRTTAIDIGTGMTTAGNINLGGANGTTNAPKLESGLISCAGNAPLSIGTFSGRTRDINIGTGMTGGTINLGGATTTIRANNIGGTTSLTLTTDTSVSNLFVDTLNPITTPLKVGTTDATIEIGRVASRITPISIGNLGLGDGTTTGSIFIGAGSNSSTSSISLGSSSLENSYIRAKTLRLNDGADAVSTIIGSTFTGNTVTINAPTTLNKPVSLSATSDPSIPDNTYRVPSTSWVNTTITNALSGLSGYVTYAGTTAFTALQTFNLGIKTNSIALVSGTELSLPASTVTAPGAADSSTRVPSTGWIATEGFAKKTVANLFTAKNEFSDVVRVNDIAGYNTPNININQAVCSAPGTTDGSDRVVSSQWVRDQGFVSSTTGFARYDTALPTASFDYLNEFKSGIRANLIQLYDPGGITALTLPTNIKTNTIELVSGTSLTLPASTTTTPPIPDNTTLVPTTTWVNTTITNAITGFVTYAGTTAFTAIQTFNAGIKTNLINALGTSDTLSINVYRMIQTLACFGTAQSTVENIIGSTTGNSGLNRCVCRIATGATSALNVFNIDTTVVSGTNIIVTQYFELYINGRNTGNNNLYSQKTSFIVTNNTGFTTIASGTFSTDKDYTTGASSVFVSFNQPSLTRMCVNVTTPSAGSTGQYYFATLVSYPTMNSNGNYQYTISTA